MTQSTALVDLDGTPVPPHHGDPDAEYRAAVDRVAVFDRSFRRLLRVTGRAPTRMLSGLATGTMPPDHEEVGERTLRGRMPYSLILTPKGRIVTDLRIARLGAGDEGALLLDVPPAGVENARQHTGKYLPPRFARLEEPEEPLGLLTIVGSGAAEVLADEIFAGEDPGVAALAEGDEIVRDDGSPTGIRVIRCGDVAPPAFDVLAGREALRALRTRLTKRDARAAGSLTWETLRLEKGRPAFGVELDDQTLPPEAGLDPRAIDHAKGCYTGQEVIVRIRDRGRVNRYLRGLVLGDVAPPEPGTPLFHSSREGASGEIRSSARSPAFGKTIALGYLRREVEPPDTVRLGMPDGPEAQARELTDRGWA